MRLSPAYVPLDFLGDVVGALSAVQLSWLRQEVSLQQFLAAVPEAMGHVRHVSHEDSSQVLKTWATAICLEICYFRLLI